MKLYAYKQESASAKKLAGALGIKRMRHVGNPINHNVINWGASNIPRGVAPNTFILNLPSAIKNASNKLVTFDKLNGYVPIPEFTKDRQEASKWLLEGATVVERHKLTGHSGDGIRIVDNVDDLQDAPMYVKYIKKTDEYRLHVFNNEVFFIQRKARNLDVPDNEVNWKVRNHKNGFIYAHQDAVVPDHVKDMAITAVDRLGLLFGAVDIIYNAHYDKYYLLEINTACGLHGTTLDKYAEQFKKFDDFLKQAGY